MSVLNPPMSISTQMFNPNVKDSRWLTLEVCREFQRTKCSRTENECKFAHPPPHVEVQNGRVTCCFDSIKGKCQRKEPPCKYLHPPQHLREQLLQNGRNNLILKNLQMQYIAAGLQPNVMPTFQQVPQQYMLSQGAAAFNPSQYAGMTMAGAGAAGAPAVNMQTIMSQVDASGGAAGASPNGQVLTGTKISRPDRLESSPPGGASNGHTVDGTTNAATNGWTSVVSVSSNGVDPHMMGTTQAGVINSVAASSSPLSHPHYSPVYLQVCREYERSSCSRAAGECRYAHPPDNVAVDQVDNTVTVCMDFIKGKCSRDSCRYFHPPPHLQAQIKLSQQRVNAAAAAAAPPQTPTQLQQMVEVINMPGTGLTAGGTGVQTIATTMPTHTSTTNPNFLHSAIAAAANAAAAKKRARDPATDDYLALNSMGGSLPSMVPVMKRPALDNKSGIPMYQPASSSAAAHAYQQALAMQLQQQQQYVPVSTGGGSMRGQPMYATYSPYLDTAVAGHPPSMPRF